MQEEFFNIYAHFLLFKCYKLIPWLHDNTDIIVWLL